MNLAEKKRLNYVVAKKLESQINYLLSVLLLEIR